MKTLLLLTALAVGLFVTTGCETVKKIAAAPVDIAVSVGTNAAVGLKKLAQPIIQDPAQPDDPTAKIVDPAIVGAAQGAAVQFGGPYGVPIAGGIGILALIVSMIATNQARKKTVTSGP